ncbi:LamG-like jellyroll fold domain-containing protein, partial [Flavobacterium sp. SUN052]|uniref:Ig-like domain-containing protein n=1 Tax=Flavobacterium sp. SUN052 TaxID=3002441 RepID=UPI002DBBC26A
MKLKFYFIILFVFYHVLSFGQAGTNLDFDGVNDAVLVNSSSVSTSLTNSTLLTVEAWVKPNANTGSRSIVSNHQGGTQFCLKAVNDTYQIFIGFGSFSVQSPANSLVVGTWQHVAGVFNGSSLSIYINGVLAGTAAASYVLPSSTNPIMIGYNGFGEYFNGSIDEVRVWKAVLTADDISRRRFCELNGNESGLLAYYKFNQGVNAANNSGVTSLPNSTATSGLNGTLSNFALTGSTSNWLSGSPVATGSIVPSAPTATAQSLCSGTTVSNLTATGTGGTLKWYNVSTGGASLVSTTALTTGTYYVSETNANGCESTRTSAAITINSLPTAPTASAQSFCGSATVANLTATGTGGTIKWYNVSTGGTALVSTTVLATATYYVTETNGNGCESTRRFVAVTINSIPTAPTATTTISYAQGATAVALTASGTNLLWYTTATGGTGNATAPTPSTATLGTTSYWVSQTVTSCESTRTQINVVTALPATHLNFDGVNDVINIPATTINNLSQGTIETWIYLNSANEEVICAKQHDGVNSFAVFSVGCFASNGGTFTSGVAGKLYFHVKNGITNLQSNTNLSTGQWYHVAVTFSTTQAIMYIDGVLQNTYAGDYSMPNDLAVTSTTLGGWPGSGGGRYLNGAIEDFRIWNTALNNTDISSRRFCELNGNESGLFAYYKFNQGLNAVDNTSVTSLINSTATSGLNGTLANFTLTGTTSNWLSGSPVTTGSFVPAAPIASAQSFCGSTTVANLIATGTGGTIKWYNVSTGGTALVTTTTLATGTYYVTQTNASGCESSRTSVAVTINAIPSAPTASAQSFCGSATVANLTATGSGGTIKWYNVSTGGTALVATTALATATYYVSETTASNCESTRTSVAVTINAIPTSPTASAQAFCGSATVANLTATGTSGTIKWYNVSTGGTALVSTTALATGTYYVTETSASSCESTRRSVAVTVNTIPTAPTASAQSFCGSTTVANLTATGTGGTIKWYNVATGGTALVSTTALLTGTYYVTETNASSCESTRRSVAVTINTIPTAPTATTTISYAQGATATALTASGSNLLWYTTATGGTGTSTAPTPSTATIGTTSYWVSQTVTNCESARTQINVVVALPATHLNFDGSDDYASSTISNLPFGNSPRTIETWVKTNTNSGGTIVNYGNQTFNQRFGILNVSSGLYIVGENNDFDTGYTINDNNWHHIAVTFDGSNLLVYVDGVVVATTTKSYNTTGSLFSVGGTFRSSFWGEFYQGNLDDVRIWNVARTATQINASKNCELQGNETGLVAYYKFNQGVNAVNNSGVTTLNGATATPNNATLTNFALTGATSNWLAGSPIITGIAVPSAPTASAQAFCGSVTVSSLTATGTGGTIKWYNVATAGTALVSTTALATGTYYVTETNANGCESTRTSVGVTINAIPSAPTASAQAFCGSATVANLTATGTGGSIKWYNVATGGTALVATTALASGTYYVSQTSVANCESTRTSVVVTINSIPTAPTSSAQSFCGSATVANLTATGTGGTIKWYNVSTGGTALVATTVLASGTYYVSQTSVANCESNRTSVAITINTIPSAPTASAQSFCGSATVANLTATGTGGTIKWYNVSTGGTALVSTTVLATGTYYVSQTSVANCESTRTSVAITINSIPTAPTASAQSFCGSSTVANLTATGTGGTIKWYNVSTGGTALISTTALATGTYYVSETLNGCEGPRTSVVVTVTPLPIVVVSANQVVCNNLSTTATQFTTTASGIVCATAPENDYLVLTAPAGKVFTSVLFASYGTPNGVCNNYTFGDCHASNSLAIVSGLIIGQNSVPILATNDTFGDPCGGTVKRLYVEAAYGNTGTINWTNDTPSIGLAASGTGNIPSFTAVNNGTTPIVATLSVTFTSNDCTSLPVPYTITVNPTSTTNEIVTACDSYTWLENGMVYTTSGVYTNTTTNSFDCSNVATLNLTINNSSTTNETVTACDSYTWLENGAVYTTSGVYTNTTTNASGCPNVAILNLTINNSSTTNETVTACDLYTWLENGAVYTTSGVYTNTTTNASGCPNVATLNLTINNSSTTSETVTACDSFTWLENGVVYTTSGVYTNTTTNASGCSNTATLVLTINNSTSSAMSITACDSYTWSANGTTYAESGVYTNITFNAAGCTDTATLVLTINNSTTSSMSVTACDSYTWSANGTTYAESGVYTNITSNASGCTDTATLVLTINNSTSSSMSVTACDSYTWSANGTTYTESGVYTNVTSNGAGCSDTATLFLTINNSTSSSMSVTACDSYTWSANGTTYTESGVYTNVTSNGAGCSDTATLFLTINNSTSSSMSVTACDSYTWSANGTTYTESGVYTNVTSNGAG